MTGDKSFFTSLEDYNDGIVIFGDRSLARVKGGWIISNPSCPKLDGVLFVDWLNANLLSISQICDKDHRVNFCQDLCKVVNKKGKVVIIGYKTIDNYYAINPNFRTPLVCSREKLNPTEL